MFPGFRKERRIAWLAGISGTFALLGLSALADLAGARIWQGVMFVASAYCLFGMISVLSRIQDLGFERRDADPMLRALTLIMTWPVAGHPAQ